MTRQSMPLVEIIPKTEGIILDLAYATPDNVTGAPLYERCACFLHPTAAVHLDRAIELAMALGYRLKIFDAYRPTEAQWRLWDYTPGSDSVADPRRGSPHSRGIAVDLTLADSTGRNLEMGTEFDDFSSAAHHGDRSVSVSAQKNRMILLGLMSSAGWDFYDKEWWHYQLFNPRLFPLLSDRAAGTRLIR